jgi:hypothetical protein
MTLTLIGIIVLVLLVAVLGLGVFGILTLSQTAINRLSFVVLTVVVLLWALGTYGKL